MIDAWCGNSPLENRFQDRWVKTLEGIKAFNFRRLEAEAYKSTF